MIATLRRRWAVAGVCLLPPLAVAALIVRPLVPEPRGQRVACWYWHRPFSLSPAERERIRAAGIERLYVYAGTVVARGGQPALERPQRWQALAPCEVYPVIRVHPAALTVLLEGRGVRSVAALVLKDRVLRAAPGLQWDADVPTGRLSEYVRFLRRYREMAPRGQRLSVTALPDWLRSADYRALCNSVDEIAPQFYGNRWPRAGEPPPPLWETGDLLAALPNVVGGRARVWIGLPSYGRCLITGKDGRPQGLRHDVDPVTWLEEPTCEVASATTRSAQWPTLRTGVEDTLRLHCSETTAAAPLTLASGCDLWFQWPRVEGLRAAVAAVRAAAPAGVEGVCFFRWPVPGEPLALPQNAIAAAVGRELPRPQAEITVEGQGPTRRVVVRNRSPDGMTSEAELSVTVQTPARHAGGADLPVDWLRDSPGSVGRLSSRAVFRRMWLGGNGRWEVCRLGEMRGPLRIALAWQGDDGRRKQRTLVLPAPSARSGPS